MSDFEKSLARPFEQGDLVKLALYTGAIVVFVWAWVQILRPVKEVAEEIAENVSDAVN